MKFEDFNEIWAVDYEFSTGPKLLPLPLCMVALEIRSGREIRLWLNDEPPAEIPLSVESNSLYIAFYSVAEVSCHLALGWKIPRNLLDLYVEYRNQTNGRKLPYGRGLLGALTHYGLDPMLTAEKDAMRELAMRGGPYREEEKRDLLDYCAKDVYALAQLFFRMKNQIHLGQALLRGRYMAAVAQMERYGIPLDTRLLQKLQENWDQIKLHLIAEVDKDFGVYDGFTFKVDRWQQWLSENYISWEFNDKGSLKLDDVTFRDACKSLPQIQPLRDLRYILAQLKLNRIAVGSDGRNRCMLSPFQSRTGRNQPSNSKFIFGPAAWLRSLIKPEPGKALAYVDWSQQEFGIAAALSGDKLMKQAYLTGDPYLEFAKQAGAVPLDATKQSHKQERDQYKACVLATQYGMGADSLANRIDDIPLKARRLLRVHRDTYQTFWRWADAAVNHAVLSNKLESIFGWAIHVQGDFNPRMIQNFPMQANGAEMLRLGCILALERGVRVLAPVHDAILVEGDSSCIHEVVETTQQALAEASQIILDGFPLRSEAEVISYPDRYLDERGTITFERVIRILQELDVS